MLQKLRIIARLPGRFLRWRRACMDEKRWRNLEMRLEESIARANRLIKEGRNKKGQFRKGHKINKVLKLRVKALEKCELFRAEVQARNNVTYIRRLLLVSSLGDLLS